MPDANIAIIVAGTLGPREYLQRIGRVLEAGARQARPRLRARHGSHERRTPRHRARKACSPDISLTSSEVDSDRIVPRWLGPRDEATWLRALHEELEDFAGLLDRRGRRARAHARQCCPRAKGRRERSRPVRRLGGRAAALGVARRFARPSERIRCRRVRSWRPSFREAEALERAAGELALSPASIEDALFADRAAQRRLTAPRSGSMARARQALQSRACAVARHAFQGARRHRLRRPRANCSRSRARRLMTTFEAVGDSRTNIEISGPLALFHATNKYRRALADLFAGARELHGLDRSSRREHRGRVVTPRGSGPTAPIATTSDASPPRVSTVERRLAVDLDRRRHSIGSSTATSFREAVVTCMCLDFTLVGPSGLVRMSRSSTTGRRRISKRSEISFGSSANRSSCASMHKTTKRFREGPNVVSFRGRIDAATLIAAADRLLSPSACPSRAPPRDEA